MTHVCPVKDCKVLVPQSRFMCPTHWRLVPPVMQQRVNAAFKAYMNAPTSRLKVALAKSLREAQAEAIEAVESKMKVTA